MKEKIIVVPNSNTLALTLAYHGVSLFNTRIFTPIELANEMLMRQAIDIDKSFISKNEELGYFVKAIKDNTYFKSQKLLDINKVKQAINSARELIVVDEEKSLEDTLKLGIFKEKNSALFDVYKKYISSLEDDKKIDTIGLIRYAIEKLDLVDSEIMTIKELELNPLAKALINKISSDVKDICLSQLFEKENRNIKINSYKNCYGSSNEVASVISEIYKNEKLDNCVVALADSNTYSQIFFDYVCKYNVPTTFGCGISIVNAFLGKLLSQYRQWSTVGQFGSEPLYRLIYSPYFNFKKLNELVKYEDAKEFNIEKFYEVLGGLRLTNNIEINNQRIADFEKAISRDINDNNRLIKYVDGIKAISNELVLPIDEFIDKYSIIRENNELLFKLDTSARSSIINDISIVKDIGLDISDDVIDNILSKSVCRQTSEPGKLYICSIDSALTSLRKNLYIIGLSATTYPGSPKENPLLLDSDLKDFNNDSLSSSGKIRQKRNTLFALIQLASNLNNNIYLSYPGLNVSELKNNNASSLLFEIYKQENGSNKSLDDFKKIIDKVGYFEPGLSNSTSIGEEYNKSSIIKFEKNDSKNNEKTSLSIYRYSPSALNTYFNCHKAFLYQNLLHIEQPEDYNPYEIISASHAGTLAHSLMEYLANDKAKNNRLMDKDEFLKLVGDVFDEYMKICVPLVGENIENEKEQFIDMLSNGYDMDERNPRDFAFAEEDKETKHPSGIIIHGFPDRVELDKNGKAIVVDFKTGRNIEHIEDDINSCLQTAIYAYIIEDKLGYIVDHSEYRYIRKNRIVKCKYDEEIKEQLNEKLMEFKQAIDSGNFDIEPMTKDEEKVKCKYCKYGSICGKVVVD